MTRHCSLRLTRTLPIVIALLCFAGIAAPAWAQFEMRATQTLPNESFGVVAGDFNHDGKQDVAVIGDYLSVLLGNGDGTFQPPVNYTALGAWIAEGDFNGDGNLDLATCDGGTSVSIFLGNGDGTFQPPTTATTTGFCRFVAVGDFNGDHKLDLVIADYYISVLLGNGDGTFQPPIDNNSFAGPQWLAVGDFNNDHKLDVIVVGGQGFGVLLGNGDGTLQPALTYSPTHDSGSVAVGDFNRDGNLDMVIGGYEGTGVTVYFGNGDGTFQTPGADYGLYGGLAVFVRDFNRDGYLDIVMGDTELLGNGDGTFRQLTEDPAINSGAGGGLEAIGDFNGDGLPDLVFLDNLSSVVITTMLNTQPLLFYPTAPLAFPVQLVNSTSAPMYVKLTNIGTTEVSIRSVTASPQFHGTDTCGGHIAAGGKCFLSVEFEPTGAGPQNGLIMLGDTASSKPQVVEVSGRGTFVALSPNPLKFGDQKVGTQSAPRKFAITNEGSTPLTISRIWLDGIYPKDFALSRTANCLNHTLAAGGACDVYVTFAPKWIGRRTATILVRDSGVGSPEIATLSGAGTRQ